MPLVHHHHQHHHGQRRYLDPNDRDVPLRASLDLPRSEGVTPYLMSSADHSRRTSMLPAGAEDIGTLAAAAAAIREKQLREERARAASRTAGLQKSLGDLNSFSTRTVQRLDDTYYSVLEKLSGLHGNLVAIKELASMAKETNDSFHADSRALVTEVESQLDALGQFDDQQNRIEELQSRIATGRQKLQKLSERVDTVREQVESWEKADREWQEKTRKRLKIIWVITSVLLFSILALFVGAQYGPALDVPALDVPTLSDMVPDSVSGNKPSGNASLLGTTTDSSRTSQNVGEKLKAALSRTRAEDAADAQVLRAFDEL